MEEKFKLLGRRVKFLRLDKGISQTKMAEQIGLSQTNLSNMESGRTAITIQNLFKMREVLDCKMADFFTEFDDAGEETPAGMKKAISIEEAVQILRLLKAVEIKDV
ncbi:MAG: helix-turn-helix transcriptional regulator [Acidaminococcaceae bacterium]|nr:helix-turn-helix transcriptional regulator [Acidaminococcaceae bacterium]